MKVITGIGTIVQRVFSPLLPMFALCIHSERPEYKHLQKRLTSVFVSH